MIEQNQIAEHKRRLRADIKQKRNALNQEERKQWSKDICRILQELPEFQDAGTVCFYYPLGSEASLLPLAKAALDLGKQAAFPRVDGSNMEFYQALSLEGFKEGAFHVMEPLGSEIVREPKMLVFVPGLAFDRRGNRMGYGKGYYDRYFTKNADCRKIGVCYGMQIVAQVPCGNYDICMDAVITEQGAMRRSQQWDTFR